MACDLSALPILTTILPILSSSKQTRSGYHHYKGLFATINRSSIIVQALQLPGMWRREPAEGTQMTRLAVFWQLLRKTD
jgi:hypothetical protein